MAKAARGEKKGITWSTIGVSLGLQILFGIVIVALATHFLFRQGDRQVEEFRKQKLAERREALKNNVDIAYAALQSGYEAAREKSVLEKTYGHRLRSIIDISEGLVRRIMARVKDGELSDEEARRLAQEEIKALRYDGDTGYVWINDTGAPYPKMIMHPTAPALDGKVLDAAKYNCALGEGKNLFSAFVEICERDGEGFVDYLWPKPTPDGLSQEDQPKLSYVRLIPEWNWILGTGIYVDDAVAEAKARLLEDIGRMRYDDGVGYFWINDTGAPYPTMVMHPVSPGLNGKVMDAEKFNCALGEDKNLFAAFVETCADDGEGFVDYRWPKPKGDGLTEEQPKLSYVRLYKPLGWIIGSGVYLDDIDRDVALRQAEVRRNTWHLLGMLVPLVALGLVFFSLRTQYSLVRPLQRIYGAVDALAEGDTEAGQNLEQRAGWCCSAMLRRLMGLIGGLNAGMRRRADMAHAVADGDLTQRAEVLSPRDTLGISLNTMIDGLNGLVTEIAQSARCLSASSQQILTASTALATQTEHVSDRSVVSSEKVEEVSSVLREVAESAGAVSSHVTEMRDEMQSMTDAIVAIGDSSREGQSISGEAMAMAETAGGTMDALGQAANEIGQVTSTIKSIAAKTNLLALNATIEAASAGEAGKGFAVVANEIKELANQSASAAEDIAERIEAMRDNSERVTETFANINSVIRRLNQSSGRNHEAVSQQRQRAIEIAERVGRIDALSNEAAAAMDELAKTMDGVTRAMRELQTISGESGNVAGELRGSAEQLSVMARKLDASVSAFQTRGAEPRADGAESDEDAGRRHAEALRQTLTVLTAERQQQAAGKPRKPIVVEMSPLSRL